ncbi:hypothetical protein [Alteribacillus bidgolensis]|uniref:Transcriptional regulator n=1 Tax=Alteribacillus bidgolensis TaxID=930129 RepID=A0A1G8IDC6_9BACI|nr:hypothetical protein [Alteribacillus bidgolensis]SDI16989.1 hypothetical protein SAMN05216352_105149 [Alteribacillus bidgolensis]
MKVQAGIVGPENSVKRICNVTKELESTFHLHAFPYESEEETLEIIKKNAHLVDVWIFSGLAPYIRAINSNETQLFFHLSIDRSSIKEMMLKISYNHQYNLERISYDSVNINVLYDIYKELDISCKQIYSYELKNEIKTTGEIVFYHEQLYSNKKIDICVTSIQSVYDELQRKNIPVFRIIPSKQNIKETLDKAYLEFQTQHFKQLQIAIMHVNLTKLEEKVDDHSISYEVHRLHLKLKAEILNFAELISGTYHSNGMGQFMVFSTRSSFQNKGQMGKPLMEKISSLTNLNVHIGIGYGDTALSADNKATLALHYAENYGDSCIFLGDEQGTIEGPLKQEQNISFSFRTEDPEVIEKLKRCGVAVTSYNKILSVQEKTENHSITASQLSTWLNMTQRNARRILNGLIQEGLAEIVGEEVPTSKGRPRKIYRLT